MSTIKKTGARTPVVRKVVRKGYNPTALPKDPVIIASSTWLLLQDFEVNLHFGQFVEFEENSKGVKFVGKKEGYLNLSGNK